MDFAPPHPDAKNRPAKWKECKGLVPLPQIAEAASLAFLTQLIGSLARVPIIKKPAE